MKSYSLLLGLIGAASVASLVLGNIEFAGYDASVLIDASWRWYSGQKPFVDFICTLPPSFYMFGGLAFHLFGVRWVSLTLAASWMFLFLAFVGLHAISLYGGKDTAAKNKWLPRVYVASLFVPLFSTNHVWHSTIAASWISYCLLTTYLLYCELTETARLKSHLWWHVALGEYVLWLSKPNTAWAALGLLLLAGISRPRLLGASSLVLATTAAMACVTLYFTGISPTAVIDSYLSVSDRPTTLFLDGFLLSDSGPMRLINGLTYLVAIVLAAGLTSIRIEPMRGLLSPSQVVAIAGVVVSLIGFGTNWDLKLNDLGPAILGAGLLTLNDTTSRWKRRLCLSGVAAACLIAIVTGGDRLRMRLAGNWSGGPGETLTAFQDSFFGDFIGRPKMIRMLAEADEIVAGTAAKSVFFGPRLEFLYARLGLESPRGLPIWWHPGSSYPIFATRQILRAWDGAKFQRLIFVRNDYTRLPPDLLRVIQRGYQLERRQGEFDVFVRR